MKNIAPKLTKPLYEQRFAELKPALSPVAALAEAHRCLYCYDSPCTAACPTHIDIPTFIKKIATGNLKGSARTILESNWMALTCAKACPVDVLCEGACVYNARGEEPISIGRLQRFAIDDYFARGMPSLFSPVQKNGKSVGVIGGGPAGLACAAQLALMGYDVTVYEAKKKAGGLATWGIAPYKMKQEDSLKEVELVKSFGVKIKTGIRVGTDISVGTLEGRHDAIFLGVGLRCPTRLPLPGEHLSGVRDALEFIETVTPRTWKSVAVGKRVGVIGGGNTAIDAATEARRLGAEHVSIIYRRGPKEMPAYAFEQELARGDGVQFHFLTQPKRILGTRHVEGIRCLKMRLGKLDAEGRRVARPIPRSEFTIPLDMVIVAIGQNVEDSFLALIPHITIDHGTVWVHPDTYQTRNPKYFAGGDCINGGKEVVNAAHDGKRAAQGIDLFLRQGE